MIVRYLALGFAITILGCSTANNNGNGGALGGAGGHSGFTTGGTAANAGDASTSGGTAPIVDGVPGPAPTWTELYDDYFGPGTAGNCVSCHATGTSPVFDSAETLCAVLKSQGYIVHTVADLEYLIEWFGLGGTMPQGGGAPPPNAVNDILAWENAQAVCP
jgi:hypothetical protein